MYKKQKAGEMYSWEKKMSGGWSILSSGYNLFRRAK
jgi:hypothetical protein